MTMHVSPTRLLTIGAILALLVLSVGGALAERIEARAAADRLSFGAPLLDHATEDGTAANAARSS